MFNINKMIIIILLLNINNIKLNPIKNDLSSTFLFNSTTDLISPSDLITTINSTTSDLITATNSTTSDLITTINLTSSDLITTINLTSSDLITTINSTTSDLITTINLTSSDLITTINSTTSDLITTINLTSSDLITTINSTTSDLILETTSNYLKPNNSINLINCSDLLNNKLYYQRFLIKEKSKKEVIKNKNNIYYHYNIKIYKNINKTCISVDIIKEYCVDMCDKKIIIVVFLSIVSFCSLLNILNYLYNRFYKKIN